MTDETNNESTTIEQTFCSPKHQEGIATFLKDDTGEFSIMRLMFAFMIFTEVALRAWIIIITQTYIPWDWPAVSLITACFASKAAQTQFEKPTQYSNYRYKSSNNDDCTGPTYGPKINFSDEDT